MVSLEFANLVVQCEKAFGKLSTRERELMYTAWYEAITIMVGAIGCAVVMPVLPCRSPEKERKRKGCRVVKRKKGNMK